MYDSALDPSFRDLAEALDDFERAPHQNAPNVLERFVAVLSSEPLAGFLRSALPTVDYEAWLAKTMASRGGMVGSGALIWPSDRAQRVALQAVFISDIAQSNKLFELSLHYFYSGDNSISSHYYRFAEIVLRPFLRDLERLTENRIVPPILFDMMGALPSSGDATLDELIRGAIAKFKDPAPATRKEGLERLWDAWERLKSLEVEGNKRVSVKALLDRAANGQFRSLLEAEATALTATGNAFQIRHFEAGKAAIEQAAHVDYLFHRLFALIHLLLYARAS
jgi:hypothetical protein